MYPGLRPDQQLAKPRRSGGKTVSLALSACLHAGAIAAMLWLPGAGAPVPAPNLYDQEIAPHKEKIVWYHLRALPKITPDVQSRSIRHPGTARPNRDTIVSHVPEAPLSTQLSWTERQKTQPRLFQAPDMISIRKQPKLAENAPQLAPEAAGRLKPAELEIPKLAPKPFVVPGARRPAMKEVRPLALSDAPNLARMPMPSGYDSSLAVLNAASGVRVPKPFTPPEAEKPGARSGNGTVAQIGDAPGIAASGSSEVNALVLNTLRSALSNGLPPASNSNVSAGPKTGVDAGGSGSGLRVPGVVVQPGGRSPSPDVAGRTVTPPEPPSYVATSIAPLQQTFSAPLAPSSRSIPAAIEARFHNRVVYSVVLPMRRVPGYGADWIMWFAEHQPENGVGTLVQVRAPLPMRKVFLQKPGLALPARIQLAAMIDRTGKVEGVSPVASASAAPADAAVEDLSMWEFLPALRNHIAIEVDVVVEITFSNIPMSPGVHPSASTAGN